MKVLHTADLHLGDLTGPIKDGENARRQDTLNCMRYIAEATAVERPNVTIIAGDTWNKSRVWADTGLSDIQDAITTMIRPVCDCSDQVVMLYGTANHDNLKAYQVLREICADLQNLHIYTEPGVETIQTMDGPVQIAALPGYDKGRLRAFMPGIDAEQENRNATELINHVLVGLGAQIKPSIPSILVAHYTVAGCDTESGQTFLAGQDVVLLPTTIDSAKFTLGTFGHIHKPQQLKTKTPCFYSGSPNQLTFNDEPWTQGFYIHDIKEDKAWSFRTDGTKTEVITSRNVESLFIETPARRHYTMELDSDLIGHYNTAGTLLWPDDIKDKIVRVKYTATPDQEKALNKAALQKYLLDAGAFYIAQIVPAEKLEDIKAEAAEQEGPREALKRWLDQADIEDIRKARLLEMAEPIITKADTGMDANKQTGAFIPLSIEVKNYRAYKAATFDFADIKMAMVNGPNGVGKSSLFMDAIADCVFEQSRDEEIGGWVRDGEKSGSVTFTFAIGSEEYRVTRTRTKSGKGTLALARKDETGEWQDQSDSTMKLTQAAVERTIGMDFQTFCSIALIRQDAYGIFLEAGSDQRMEVLSTLLGLEMYGTMEEASKQEEKERRKEIAQANDRINVLQEQIEEKETQQALLQAYMEKGNAAKIELDAIQEKIQQQEATATMRTELLHQMRLKEQEAEDFKRQADEKNRSAQLARYTIDKERQLADSLPLAEKAAAEQKEARAKLDGLTPDIERLRKLQDEKRFLQNEILTHTDAARIATEELKRASGIIDRKEEIEAARDEMERLEALREQATAAMADWNEAKEKERKIQKELETARIFTTQHLKQLQDKIDAAKLSATTLESSGCPVPENATCKFLKQAVEAKASIPDMEKNLEGIKAEKEAEILALESALEAASSNRNAMTDPNIQLAGISREMADKKQTADLYPLLGRAEAKTKELQIKINEATAATESKQKRVDEINTQLKALDFVEEAKESAEAAIANNSTLADLLPACKESKAKMEAAAAMVGQYLKEIDELEKKAEAARAAAEKIHGKMADVYEWNENMDTLTERKKDLERLSQEAAEERGKIKAKLESIDEAVAMVNEYRKQKMKASTELADYGFLTKAFGLDGIQYMIVKGICPEIMDRANDILAAMTGGKMAVDIKTERQVKSTGKEVNSLEVWIKNLSGTVRPYNSHSGGEKVRIALAVTLAMADVKARHAGVHIEMLFLDEPAYLDSDGTEAYADALDELANRNKGMRIMAISHDPAMKARFSQNITVYAGDEGSTITCEL